MSAKQHENIFNKRKTSVLTSAGKLEEDNLEETAADNIIESKPEVEVVTKTVEVKEEKKEETPIPEITQDIEVVKEQPTKSGSIILFAEEIEEKTYANFYLKKSTIARIDKIAGKGKKKSVKSKSALVDRLLNEALDRLEIK